MRIDRIRTVIVFIAIIIVLAFFGFYVQVDTRHSRDMRVRQESFMEQETARMQAEINGLRQLQQEVNNAGFVTGNALTQERKNARRLQKKLDFLISQNRSLSDKMKVALRDKQGIERVKNEFDRHLEDLTIQNAGLQKEVDLLRKNFDVALQARARLVRVQEAIDGLTIEKGKEDILQMQIAALTREVEDTNQYLIEIRENRIVPRLEVPGVPSSGSGVKSQEQVNDLKARINILTNENTLLKEKYSLAQDNADQYKNALDAGAEKLYALQSRLIETESALSQSNARSQDLEHNMASLRERYAANELEKQGLRIKLNQLSSELDEVRNKFLAALGKISDILQSPGEISSGARSNLTSIIGVELFPRPTDTE